MSSALSKLQAAAGRTGVLLLSLTALITICFAPAMAQQKEHHPHDSKSDRPISAGYLA